jgi:hypothetical protein
VIRDPSLVDKIYREHHLVGILLYVSTLVVVAAMCFLGLALRFFHDQPRLGRSTSSVSETVSADLKPSVDVHADITDPPEGQVGQGNVWTGYAISVPDDATVFLAILNPGDQPSLLQGHSSTTNGREGGPIHSIAEKCGGFWPQHRPGADDGRFNHIYIRRRLSVSISPIAFYRYQYNIF